jgi:hypothetical protein
MVFAAKTTASALIALLIAFTFNLDATGARPGLG